MPSIINASTSAGLVQTADTSGILQLQTAGTTAVTVDSSQNVGIGITSPTAKLHTQIGSGVSNGIKALNGGGSGLQFYTDSNVANADVFIESPLTGVAMAFLNGGSERMRINSSGYLLVGCTSVPSSSVAGVGFSPSVVSVAPHRFSTGSGTGVVTVMTFANGNGVIGAINTSGSNTVYATSSDYRLKENIAPMTGALSKVVQLNPCTYTWKSDGANGQGFIAHELAEIFPDAVVGEKDAVDIDGEIKPQQIDTSFLVATLTAAIQELKAELDATKAEVAALKGTV